PLAQIAPPPLAQPPRSVPLTPTAAQPPAPSIPTPCLCRRRPSPPTASRSTPPLPDAAAVASPRPIPDAAATHADAPTPRQPATLPRPSRQSSIHIYDRRLSPPRALLTADPHPHRGQPRKPATTSSAGAADSLRRPHRRSTPRRLSPPRSLPTADPQRGQPNHIHTAVPGGEPPTTRICDFRLGIQLKCS
ncbi:Os03g0177100, partial [Oryza sativa Japonica Group]